MSHGIPENRIVCQTGKHVVPFRLDFVSISDRKDRAIELTESKFYIKSRAREKERDDSRRRLMRIVATPNGASVWFIGKESLFPNEWIGHLARRPTSGWNIVIRRKCDWAQGHPSCVFLSDPVPTTSVLDLESLSTDLSLVIDTREIKRHA